MCCLTDLDRPKSSQAPSALLHGTSDPSHPICISAFMSGAKQPTQGLVLSRVLRWRFYWLTHRAQLHNHPCVMSPDSYQKTLLYIFPISLVNFSRHLTRGHIPAPPQYRTVKTLSKRNTSYTRLHASKGSLCKHELSVEWMILGRVPWVDLYVWSVEHSPMTH